MAQTPIEDVWDAGRQWSKKLNDMGVDNAYQLSLTNAEDIQKTSNKVLASTVLELQGKSVLDIEKQIVVSRSLGR